MSIKEYEEEKKKILDKIDLITKEKDKIDAELEKQSNDYLDEANKRYKQGGNWLKMEKHNGKEATHVQVSLDNNVRIAREKADKIKKQKDSEIKKHHNALDALEKTCKSIVWAWQLAKSRSSKPGGRNEKLEAGPVQSDMTLDSHIYGGGFAWIEPFWEKGKPTGSPKNGIYIHTSPKNSTVKAAEWYGFKDSENPVKIQGPVASGSKVQLHIYTQSMYGKNIGVELKANGEILKANSYSWGIEVSASKTKNEEPSKTNGAKYDILESEDLFLTEVEIYDCSDANSIKPPAEAVTGYLLNDQGGKKQDYLNVQKAVLNLYIDPAWCMRKTGIITVVPTIHYDGKKQEMAAATLKISASSTPDIKIPESGNKPVLIDNVETNFEAFHHCRYDVIKGSYAKLDDRKNNENQEIIIFDSKKNNSERTELYMPVIAGHKQARRNVKITLDSNTVECSFDGDKVNDHEKKVIDLSLIQEAVVVEENTKVDEHLIIRDDIIKLEDLRMTFEKEEEGHGDTNDDNEINATHSTTRGSVKGSVGISSTSKTTTFKDERKIGRYPNSDTEIVLDIGYQYNGSLIKYIWPTRKAIVQNYPVLLHTCAYPQKTLNIQVYPDIKWILQFAYDCDPEEFNEMRGDAYDKYLVKVEKLDDKYKPEEIESKISRIDADLENARENLRTAKKENKKNAKKLIEKLEAKKAKQQAKSKKYNKESLKAKKEHKKDRPDLFNFKENISSGLSDLVLSLNVEYDRPGEAIEISASYKRYVNLVKQLIDVKNTVELILDGKKKSQKKLDKKFREIDEKDAGEKLKNIGEALKGRPLCSIDIIPPSLAILGSWYAESPKDINTNYVGIVGEIQVIAKPFIGAAITMDFLALAQKAHPIARGIITVIDVAEAAGVGPKITLEMELSGELEIEGKLMYNSASGNTNFNQNSLSKDSEDDSPLTVSGVFKLEIRGKIEFSKKANSYIFGSVTAYANAAFEVKTGLTLSGAIKADEKGFFIDPLLTFHGLIVSGVAEAGYKVENTDGGEYFSDSIEGSFDLVLMHEYEGRFENSSGDKVQLYIT
ncbi:hypothetical protein J2810_001814 [Chryseobacterium rhizosphaerae]|uniref:hypothetical protein n=1 Tax=Chryseobacterium rhizosphaerae TaxID=395937 RepID=UPI00285CBC0C|nr:hypothetical protein [Chryseobacterium rhizosphaerae]MDR6545766.1 hypothetical protein [Chryseobacterium rhizosphaerae]